MNHDNRSARSPAHAHRSLTRRYSNAFTPNGCARCTLAPCSRSIDVVDDPDPLEDLSRGRHPHQHRPATMQIHTHKLPSRLRFHQGASFVVKREHPQHPPGTHEERRPRSFIASGGHMYHRRLAQRQGWVGPIAVDEMLRARIYIGALEGL
jgi:hypothetical protein